MCGYLVAADRLSEARAIAREAFQKSAEYDRDLMPMTCLISTPLSPSSLTVTFGRALSWPATPKPPLFVSVTGANIPSN